MVLFESKPLEGEYRTRLQMYVDVLQAIREPTKLTRIMLRTNINPSRIHTILTNLIEKGMVDKQPAPTPRRKSTKALYQLTTKGRILLAKWGEFMQIWNGEM